MRTTLSALAACALLAGGCSTTASNVVSTDGGQLMADLGVLSADSMEGRRAGTAGGERARRYLLRRFAEVGLRPVGPSFEHPFSFAGRDSTQIRGVNLVGLLPGRDTTAPYLVVTAHYDHVGVQQGEIFNGADDNASGTAALLALASHFARRPTRHPLLLVAFDAEEMGLRGARAFVAAPPVPRSRIALNVNMDMVGRNERGELFVAGTHHYPALRAPLERVAARAPVKLRFGHDSPDLPRGEDWTHQSDHGAFHQAGIPFLYFGVEDHPDYHRPTDDLERITPAFFAGAVSTVIHAVRELDAALP